MKKILVKLFEKSKDRPIVLALFILFSGQVFAAAIQTNVQALEDVYANDFYIGCILSYKHIGFPDDPYMPDQSSIYIS